VDNEVTVEWDRSTENFLFSAMEIKKELLISFANTDKLY